MGHTVNNRDPKPHSRSLKSGVPTYFEVDDLGIGFHNGVSEEGRVTKEHLVGENPQGPPVAFCAIGMRSIFHGSQDLRGEVIWSAHRDGRADLAPREQ